MAMARKLRMGMVGGSLDAFIGAVHRMAAWLDGEIDLVCGAFSRSLVSQIFRQSFVEDVLRDHKIPVFISHR